MEDIGKYVWVEHETYSWLPARIVDTVENKYKFLTKIDGHEIVTYDLKKKEYSEVHPSCLKGVDDLLWLGDFNQQTLLHNTRERFSQDKIYSFIGMPILIAVNPYKNINLYNDEFIKYYKDFFLKLRSNPNLVGHPIPHLYHLAEAAYQDMINEKKNQSIIISGESGSGKTQSTKIILKYLAVSSLATKDKDMEDVITVEKQVLDSNPLLEAFGNAKTVKNNNSSRFGKFIQVSFTDHGKILSARIYNYLLEKSRVVKIQHEERSYHIFYQFLLGANDNEREMYKIKNIKYYDYLNSGCYEVDDTDDKQNFLETKECMAKLTFSANEIHFILSIISGILYLGNVKFVEGCKNGNTIAVVDPLTKSDFENAAMYLGIDDTALESILTIRKMNDPMSKQVFHRNLSVEKAYSCRDAIAKAMYCRMFDFIVAKVNRAILNKDEMGKYDKGKIRKIGLLDIFGFENFEVNSFEQLCINYANERLQQYFNNHIFKLEQDEYKKEGIDWSQVEFTDNKEIIELIDDSKISIFAILDSEGITPNPSDQSFRNKVYSHCMSNAALGDDTEDHISIDHYAGMVYYYVEGFVEKNLDQLTHDIIEAMGNSKNKLVKKLFEQKESESTYNKKSTKKSAGCSNSNSVPYKLQSDSLSKQFKLQLDELLLMLSQSNPRYVKCIKPNSLKKPQILDSIDVMEQLLSAGVLEAIKIRKQGYSIRRTKEEFVKRYHPLIPQIDIKKCDLNHDYHDATLLMLKLLGDNPDIRELFDPSKKLIQLGLSKIFMKEEVKTILESKLNRIKYINRIQSKFRGFVVYRRVHKILFGIRTIQAQWRGVLAREYLICLKKETVRIQKFFRSFKIKKRILLEIARLKEIARQKALELEKLNTSHIDLPSSQKKKKTKGRQKRQVECERTSDTSTKDINSSNIVDASCSDFFYDKDNPLNISKREKLQNKKAVQLQLRSQFPEVLSIQSVVGNELKIKFEALQEELDNTKREKENVVQEINVYKDMKRNYETEIAALVKENECTVQKLKEESNRVVICNHEELIKQLKKEMSENEGVIDILNLKNEDLVRSNKTLQEINENLKEQLNKRKEKMDKEMSAVYQQFQDLKNEFERKFANEQSQLNTTTTPLKSQDLKALAELKMENKQMTKKIEDIKARQEKELKTIRSEIMNKDLKIKDYEIKLAKLEKENKDKTDLYTNIKKECDLCNDKLIDMKTKLEQLNKNSKINECELEIHKIRSEFDSIVKKKDAELKEIKESYDNISNSNEKFKRLEKALKSQIAEKEGEIVKYQQMSSEARQENEKLIDENIILTKNNYSLKSQVEVYEALAYAKNRNENEIKNKNKEIQELKENEKKYQMNLMQCKDTIAKKQRVIESKNQMNMLLIELVKVKKSEVQCIEGLHLTGSNNLKEALTDIRDRESKLLASLAEVSKDLDNTESESESSEEEEEEEDSSNDDN